MANIFPRWSNLLPLKIAVRIGSAVAGVALAFNYYATPKSLTVGDQSLLLQPLSLLQLHPCLLFWIVNHLTRPPG